MPDMQYPHDYKKLHGAPHNPTPGPWPYIITLTLITIATIAIITTAP